MVLPFKPLSMAFDDVKYFVDMPMVSLLKCHTFIFGAMTIDSKMLESQKT